MRRSLFAVAIAALLVACGSLRAEELVYTRFADYIEALRVQSGIPGLAAAVIGRNEVLWQRSFGYQNVERGMPMRSDTPASLDGLTQVVTSAMVLRCVEEGRLSLDQTIGEFDPQTPEPAATLRQLLAHTSGPSNAPVFLYHPERVEAIAPAIEACTGMSFRESVADLLDRLAMADSVPGPDALEVPWPLDPEPELRLARYSARLERLATPYIVDTQRRAAPTQYTVTTLGPSKGLLASALDLAQFDLALRRGLLVQTETLIGAWRAPVDSTGKALPHGLGWFVQQYNGEPVVWQFGMSTGPGSSSLIVTLPARGITLVLLANSNGLTRPFPLSGGDVTTSPFGRVFLALFTR
ncbi:MAG: serine hydrolase domain-containing protein [Vicinamibacterales bacterium]